MNTDIGTTNNLFTPKLTEKDFLRFSKFIHSYYGITLPGSKKTMLESRIQKRLRSLRMNSFGEYADYVFSPEGYEKEVVHLIDVVTTNKTDFFREPGCFGYLLNTALPSLINAHGAELRRKFKVWSAACSSGEEPYTLAMMLHEFSEQNPRFQFSILATDISTRMLKIGTRAVYGMERLDPVPQALRNRYFMFSRDKEKKLVRIVPELRSLVKFRRLNLMDEKYDIGEHADIIFCRNVIIYFDRSTQEKLLRRLCMHLTPRGYLILGHSEMLTGMSLPLERVAPTVYRIHK